MVLRSLPLVEDMLPLLRLRGSEWSNLSDLMTPDHQSNEKHESKQAKEGHYSIYPTDTDRCNPGVDVEVDGKTEKQTHRVENQGGLGGVCPETLTDVVDRDRNADQRADGDEELSQRKHHPVELIVQGNATEPEPKGHEKEVGRPHGVEAVLGFPHALVASDEPQRDAIAEELTVQQSDDEADPVDKGDCITPVSANSLTQLQVKQKLTSSVV
jgi:hypothetical protein